MITTIQQGASIHGLDAYSTTFHSSTRTLYASTFLANWQPVCVPHVCSISISILGLRGVAEEALRESVNSFHQSCAAHSEIGLQKNSFDCPGN